jgi:hypothetical protein
MSSMSVDVLIPLIFSPKRCGMEHTFDNCKIRSCVASLTFFSSHCWSSIINHIQPHTQLIVRWYLQPHLQMQSLHKTLISKLCVPFQYVGPSQPFLTCRALAVSSYDVFITLFHQDCFVIRLGMIVFLQVYFSATSVLIHFVGRLFLLHGSWTQGWGVLFHVYLEGILGISSWKCHVRAHVAFPWSF